MNNNEQLLTIEVQTRTVKFAEWIMTLKPSDFNSTKGYEIHRLVTKFAELILDKDHEEDLKLQETAQQIFTEDIPL